MLGGAALLKAQAVIPFPIQNFVIPAKAGISVHQ